MIPAPSWDVTNVLLAITVSKLGRIVATSTFIVGDMEVYAD